MSSPHSARPGRHSTGFLYAEPPETYPDISLPKEDPVPATIRVNAVPRRRRGARKAARVLRGRTVDRIAVRRLFKRTVPKENNFRHGNTKWTPEELTEQDKTEADDLFRTYAIDDSGRLAAIEKWKTFLALNVLQPCGESLRLWVGQAKRSGLGPGSRHTYATYFKSTIPRDDPLVKKVMKSVMRAHADYDTSQAPFVEFADLCRIIEAIEDLTMRAMCYVMLIAGLRPEGARWLRHSQLNAEPQDATSEKQILLIVQVRVDKNAWKRVHRDELSLLRSFTPTLLSFPTEVRKRINGRSDMQDSRPFWNYSNTALNNALRSVAESHSLPHATSTSFRKSYMQRTFERCKGNMDEVKRWTLHHSKFVTKAHYVQWQCTQNKETVGYLDPDMRSSDSEESADDEDS